MAEALRVRAHQREARVDFLEVFVADVLLDVVVACVGMCGESSELSCHQLKWFHFWGFSWMCWSCVSLYLWTLCYESWSRYLVWWRK